MSQRVCVPCMIARNQEAHPGEKWWWYDSDVMMATCNRCGKHVVTYIPSGPPQPKRRARRHYRGKNQ